MSIKRLKEQYLEKLWTMKEKNTNSIQDLSAGMKINDHEKIIKELQRDDLIQTEGDEISLTATGEEHVQKIIRAYRLAEKLLFDAMDDDYEADNCKFEHLLKNEMVDSICILLGHPRECPHGRPIPQGDCCKKSLKTAQSTVMPLISMEVLQSSRIAYINVQKNNLLWDKIKALKIGKGSLVTLEQKTPSIVILCEGVDIALDESIAADIYVWKNCTKNRMPRVCKQSNCKQSRLVFGLKGRS